MELMDVMDSEDTTILDMMDTTTEEALALSLDSVEQEAFIKYFNSLSEKPLTTVRFFDRNDYYSVHGADTTTVSKDIFSFTFSIKTMGVEPNNLDYLVVSKDNFDMLVKKLLLVRRYRIEIYVAEGSMKANKWSLMYKASPGYLSQLEEVLNDTVVGFDEQTSCLMSINIKTDPVTKVRVLGVACVTATEYNMSVTEFTDDDLFTKLETITVQLAPTECLVPQSESDDYKDVVKILKRTNIPVNKVPKKDFSTDGIIQDLTRLLKFASRQQPDASVLLETSKTVAMSSLAAIIKYTSMLAEYTNFGRYSLTTIQSECYLHLDAAALAALNVLPEPGDTSHSPSRSLLGLLDKCRTQQGKRLLSQWLRQPLRDINLINERLDIVEVLVNNSRLRLQLYEDHMRRIPDLQALARKLTKKKATLNDCYKIYQVITHLPSLLRCLAAADNSTVHSSMSELISELSSDLDKYRELIENTFDMDSVERGDLLLKPSFDEELQELYSRMRALESEAERELKIAARELNFEPGKTIKLENDSNNGFHFRITKRSEEAIRKHKKYTIIEAVKGGVRFKNNIMTDITDEYEQLKSTYEAEQEKLFLEIIEVAAGYTECLFCLSYILARLDVLLAFSMVAAGAPCPYVRPIVTESTDEFILKDVRHPCLEVQDGVSYIPNDVEFKRGSQILHIVTGANMGGKSTWLRSCGVVALLAHVGSMVPASYAKVPRLKSLGARVGATDREDKGQSTFFVEMIECATLLRIATPDSLVLIDEVGRGTSTYEGCGIAWAIAEELALKIQCFTLFATHFHELTRLAHQHPGVVVNSHTGINVVDNKVLLMHKIAPGPEINSYGLQIAKLAGIPDSVIKHAEEYQSEHAVNTCQIEAGLDPQEIAAGQQIVFEYAHKYNQLDKTNEEEMAKQLQALREEVWKTDNKYVLALLNARRKANV